MLYYQRRNPVKNSIHVIKKIDYLVGPLLLKFSSLLSSSRHAGSVPNSLKKILVIRPGGIGDAVLLIPSLKILREIKPSMEVDILCEPRNMGVFLGSPFVSGLYNYRSLTDLVRLSMNDYQIVFDTEQSHFLSAVVVSKFRHSLKVGFATNGREEIYDIAVPYRQDQYEMDSFFDLFKEVINGWPTEPGWNPPYFFVSPEQKERVAREVQEIDRPLVCVFPGASIKERHWPTKNWATVIRRLWDEGFMSAVLGGANESALSQEVVKAARCPVLNLCSKLTLGETTALFNHARLLISTDSGILHLGVLCDIPTVSLFGPGIAQKWGPRGDKHIVLNKGLECSPCTLFGETPPCPRGALCMKQITADEVIDAAFRLVK
ncbi:MAG: glycosyltransferase family 9 protein [Deltaproteobacteria bacterium]|nr:MAG: glycosyltransferase family 9 protein [Deltaproteobacteria bacterium]